MRALRKIICIASTLGLLAVNSTYALIVYGTTNEDAEVKYDASSNAAHCSVVTTSSNCSAVYLGNGWFITANHVSLAVNSNVRQNGNYATITQIDTTLNTSYGADLKLFHVEDTSTLEDLEAINLSTEIYSKIQGTGMLGDQLIRGSELTLVGAGYGREEDSDIYATTVVADKRRGTIRYGTATTLSQNLQIEVNGVTYSTFATVAEARDGATSALTGDSGGGMFFEYAGDFYLVGLITWVSPETAAETIVFGQIVDEFEKETNYSHTLAINLKDYLPQISEITGVSIPEPAHYALIISILGLCGILATKTKRK